MLLRLLEHLSPCLISYSHGYILSYSSSLFRVFVAAARAIQELNYIPLYGKPIRVMYSHRDPSVRRSGAGNIFIKVLLSVSFPDFRL